MEQGLPKAIQAQLEQAEAIEQQIAAEKSASEPGNTEQPPAETPPATEEPQITQQQPEPVVEQQTAADAEWKRRYEILQGKYNAEVPRLSEQLRGTTEALAQMRGELDKLKSAPPPEQNKAPLVTKEDEETFGSDMIDLNRRVASELLQPLTSRLAVVEEALQQLVGLYQKVTSVEQQQVQTAQERFWNALSSAVPDWEQINKDTKWLDWLTEYDPVAGRTRQESLDEASNNLDSKRVIGMFSLWKSMFAAPEPAKANNKQELSRQVAPAKQNGAASQPVADKLWTLRDYEAAFDPRLSQSMSAKEIEALQAEADRALAEGRVR